MQVKLTIGERLKDLRVERKLTLEQLSRRGGYLEIRTWQI